ncbi:Ppx/GppA family phosphatase [Rhizobium sp. ARZ01]|uniref:Ppx/GppA phosphatase family protein n=1 Tax=Rhizobium sp. ARZ01 TaxID=2769313 RepID=UPI001783B74D|nr:Ppx/GppA family phosphatase [Rhizobium sp. ARZ01]MBD9373798.1 Ppx/GppA family phosphatase [Rhizobium sp. ARZ01]
MAAIVPRWEWRTFGAHFGIAETRFAALTPGAIQESDELYFLGGSGANVKVRDDLMDIKVLREVNADGLERWEPVMKQPFPLPAAEAAKVFESLGLAAPQLARDAYSLDEFVAEVVVPSGALRPVGVHKRRVRYTVGGCTSELTDVQSEGRSTRTIAIEGEDAAAVVAAVESIGLGGYFNTNYALGLQALLEDTPERFAVIDVGTNSVKLHVGERDSTGSWRTIVDRAELTRLGEGLEKSGEIAPEAAARTASAIEDMSDEAKRNGVRAIAAVGTAGLRIARNSAAVLDMIRTRTGISIEVIPGADEGRLAYLAVKAWLRMPEGALAVFDTGGGSTQFTFGQGSRVDEQFSVNVGAVRYTERFGLAGTVAPDVLRDTFAAITADLSRIEGRPSPDVLVAMGGAITNIAAVKHSLDRYDADIVQGTVLDRAEIDRQIEMFRLRNAEERRTIVGLQPKRADVILAGACVVRTVMDMLGQNSLTVSDRGLRHGVLVERFGG